MPSVTSRNSTFRARCSVRNILSNVQNPQDNAFYEFLGLLPHATPDQCVCAHCGTLAQMADSNTRTLRSGETMVYYCSPACRDAWGVCWSCGELTARVRGVQHDDRLYCTSCFRDNYIRCGGCQAVVRRNGARWDNYHDTGYCEDCWDANFTTCCNCGNDMHINNSCRYPIGLPTPGGRMHGPYCERCWESMQTALHSWDYRPRPIFYGEGDVHYGIEVEIDKLDDSPRSIAKFIVDKLNPSEDIFYCKHDGSLMSGYEYVFHPRTPRAWVTLRDSELLKDMMDMTRKFGGRSFNTTTCGIHVHRSRKDLGIISQSKLVMLFTVLRRQIIKVAQRTSSYASFDVFTQTKGDKLCTYKLINHGEHVNERYQALNFQPRHTVEFRVFKGTLKIDTLMAYIGFCHHITDFAKSMLLNDLMHNSPEDLWSRFCEFLDMRVHKPLAEETIAYLLRKGLFTCKRKNSQGVAPELDLNPFND